MTDREALEAIRDAMKESDKQVTDSLAKIASVLLIFSIEVEAILNEVGLVVDSEN